MAKTSDKQLVAADVKLNFDENRYNFFSKKMDLDLEFEESTG